MHQFVQVDSENDLTCKQCQIKLKHYKKKYEMYTLVYPMFKSHCICNFTSSNTSKLINYAEKAEPFTISFDDSMHPSKFYSYEINFLNDNNPKDENILFLNL